ncbi:MAG: hypothetical protein HKN28_06835 [Alphaproteobacteria bacterium]|nr:hypothetical protein [Alphaproteobacteria bacterium]
MTLARAELKRIIDSSRALAFNCHDIGSRIASDDDAGKLFNNKLLNNTLFIKSMERDERGPVSILKMRTLIYFPYDLSEVAAGGDSILFDDPGFLAALQHKIGLDSATSDDRANYAEDFEILKMVRSLPTFDPFLLKSKAQQLDLHDRIHPDYFDISESDWLKIRQPIRLKIQELVECAIGKTEQDTKSAAIQKYVLLFLEKIWEAKNIDGIEDFVASLEMSPERAPDLFFAWKAICYYQAEFASAQSDVQDFSNWLGDDAFVYPSNWVQLHPDEKSQFEASIEQLRARVSASYREIGSVLDDYEDSYRKFLEEGLPQDFKGFLSSADRKYIKLAANLSAHLHGVTIWNSMTKKFSDRLSYNKSNELIDTLSGLFGVQVTPLLTRQLAS